MNYHKLSTSLMIYHFFLYYFSNSKLSMICFLQFFFIKRSKNFFIVRITNNICPWNSIFNFFNQKNFFRTNFECKLLQKYFCLEFLTNDLQKVANSNHISAWKSKGLSDESIKPPAASNNSLAPVLNYIKSKVSCLKQDKLTFTYIKVINICIIHKINFWPFNVGKDFALISFLFETVKLTKNTDPGKCKYSGLGIGFNAHGSFFVSKWLWV